MPIYAEIEKREISFGGEHHQGWLPKNASTPPPTSIETVTCHFQITDDGGGGVLLIYESDSATCCGDTWHHTVKEAVEAAQRWFNIIEDEWLFTQSDFV
jgi:hypothetical protein